MEGPCLRCWPGSPHRYSRQGFQGRFDSSNWKLASQELSRFAAGKLELRDLISGSIDDGLPLLFFFSDHSALEVKRDDAGLHISSGMH